MTSSEHEHDTAADRWLANQRGDFPDPSGQAIPVRVIEMPQEVQRRATILTADTLNIASGDVLSKRLLAAQVRRSTAQVRNLSGAVVIQVAGSDQGGWGTVPPGQSITLGHSGPVWVRSDGTAAVAVSVFAEHREEV